MFTVKTISGSTFTAISVHTAQELGKQALLIKQGNQWRLVPATYAAFLGEGLLITEFYPV